MSSTVTTPSLGRKQRTSNAAFLDAWKNIETIISRQHIDRLLERTLLDIQDKIRGKFVGYGWSGGKDSQALRVLMNLAGIHCCVMGMTCELEYPEFLRWVTDHMPWELDVIETGQDLEWLAKHPQMLFPQDATTAAKWFHLVQHKAQTVFTRRYGLDMLIVGRRRQDGNYMGPDGAGLYSNQRGVTYYCPLKDWTHEEIIACCHYYKQDFAPCYQWPNGFVVGTGAWPARQYTRSTRQAWSEIDQIDRSVIETAARYFQSAREYLCAVSSDS